MKERNSMAEIKEMKPGMTEQKKQAVLEQLWLVALLVSPLTVKLAVAVMVYLPSLA